MVGRRTPGAALKRVEQMDFDILVPGHGRQGNKGNATDFRLYLEDLQGQVFTLVREGKTLEEVKAAVDLSKYKDLGGFDRMSQANIEGMYREVSQHRRPNE